MDLRLPVPRLGCRDCGVVRQAVIRLAKPLSRVTHAFERYALGLLSHMTIQAVADHLQVGWDRIKALFKRQLESQFGQPKLKHVGGIRRVLVVGPPGFDLTPLRRQLNGEELIDLDAKKPVAMLSGVGNTDKGVIPYLDESETWSTVSPVILPGFDDPDGLRKKLKERDGKKADEQKHLLERLDRNILKLIWKAFHQAGWTAVALAGASVEYRKVGWVRGLDLAKNYDLPPLRYPRYHVRVAFPRPVRGPLAVGAGRYRGFGLFVAEG